MRSVFDKNASQCPVCDFYLSLQGHFMADLCNVSAADADTLVKLWGIWRAEYSLPVAALLRGGEGVLRVLRWGDLNNE